jgi:hypothetical protein
VPASTPVRRRKSYSPRLTGGPRPVSVARIGSTFHCSANREQRMSGLLDLLLACNTYRVVVERTVPELAARLQDTLGSPPGSRQTGAAPHTERTPGRPLPRRGGSWRRGKGRWWRCVCGTGGRWYSSLGSSYCWRSRAHSLNLEAPRCWPLRLHCGNSGCTRTCGGSAGTSARCWCLRGGHLQRDPAAVPTAEQTVLQTGPSRRLRAWARRQVFWGGPSRLQ